MNIALLLAVFGVRQKVTETITSSRTWVAPARTTMLVSLAGRGQDGTPYVPGQSGYDTYSTATYYPPNNGTPQQGPLTFVGTTYGASPPNPYCTGVQNQDGSRNETCYSYIEFDLSKPKTIGANTTGFNKTFAGGDGVPAVAPAPYTNVPVTPNAPYNLVVPSGGYLTLTYYK